MRREKVVNLLTSKLTILLFFSLIAHHGTNYLNHRFFEPLHHLFASSIELRCGGRVILALPFFGIKRILEARNIDGGASLISSLGYIVRYKLHQIPDFIFFGSRKNAQRFYLRVEIPFQFRYSIQRIETGFLGQVEQLSQNLTAQGVTLIVLPIPTKISIERRFLPSILPSEEVWTSSLKKDRDRERSREDAYGVYSTLVKNNPRVVVDLFKVYSEYSQIHPDQELFIPTDSHWSSLGIALAAEAIIDKLNEMGWKMRSPEILFPDPSDKIKYNFTHLLGTFRLPTFFLDSRPEFSWEEPLYRISRVTGAKTRKRVVVAGSSYSHRMKNTAFGLGNLVARSLGRQLFDFSRPVRKMEPPLRFIQASKFRLVRGDVLIWEFPIRLPFEIIQKSPAL